VRRGSLTVVGTGIRLVGDLTLEAVAQIRVADRVLYLVNNPAMVHWLRLQNPRLDSLHDCYAEGKPRERSYAEMVARILAPVRRGRRVCAVFYGHPGVFVGPSHDAVRCARREGFEARMLPGVSADGCLFAELGVDPADRGCQSFEASDFLDRRIRHSTACDLILWQVGLIGEPSIRFDDGSDRSGWRRLLASLARRYPSGHRAVLYEASPYPVCAPRVTYRPLPELVEERLKWYTTLYVPAAGVRLRLAAARQARGLRAASLHSHH